MAGIIRNTRDHTFCPLCGGKIDHGAEIRFARGQGYIARFGRVIRISNVQMQIFLELMMRFPRTVTHERLEYLLYDDGEPSEAAVNVIICNMNKQLGLLGIRAKSRDRNWSLYFSDEAELRQADAA